MCEDKAMKKSVLIITAIIIVSGAANALSNFSSGDKKISGALYDASEYYTASVRAQYCIYNVRNIQSDCSNSVYEAIKSE